MTCYVQSIINHLYQHLCVSETPIVENRGNKDTPHTHFHYPTTCTYFTSGVQRKKDRYFDDSCCNQNGHFYGIDGHDNN